MAKRTPGQGAVCALAAIVALGTIGLVAPAAAGKADDAERHHAQAKHEHARVYYRPFCRRAHHVADRNAPCWG